MLPPGEECVATALVQIKGYQRYVFAQAAVVAVLVVLVLPHSPGGLVAGLVAGALVLGFIRAVTLVASRALAQAPKVDGATIAERSGSSIMAQLVLTTKRLVVIPVGLGTRTKPADVPRSQLAAISVTGGRRVLKPVVIEFTDGSTLTYLASSDANVRRVSAMGEAIQAAAR